VNNMSFLVADVVIIFLFLQLTATTDITCCTDSSYRMPYASCGMANSYCFQCDVAGSFAKINMTTGKDERCVQFTECPTDVICGLTPSRSELNF